MDLVEAAGAGGARHPWEQARARFFLRVLEGARVAAREGSVLDVGAGDAWFARELSRRFPGLADVACWDVGYDGAVLGSPDFAASPPLRFCRERPQGSFSVLLLLDVLEHVEDDAAFLASLVSANLRAGGFALVSVPAWPILFGAHDVHLRHHRRYAPASGRRLLEGAGLEIVSSGGLFASLLPVRALQAGLGKIARSKVPPRDAGRWTAPPLVTAVARAALSCDARICLAGARLGITVPGLSWWALCRKPSR